MLKRNFKGRVDINEFNHGCKFASRYISCTTENEEAKKIILNNNFHKENSFCYYLLYEDDNFKSDVVEKMVKELLQNDIHVNFFAYQTDRTGEWIYVSNEEAFKKYLSGSKRKKAREISEKESN